MKIIASLFLFVFCSLSFVWVAAEWEVLTWEILPEFKENIPLEDTLKIDISNIVNSYQEYFGIEDLTFQWDVKWKSPVTGTILEEKFQEPGVKDITLSIFNLPEWQENKILLDSSNFQVFVYEKSLPFIFSNTIPEIQKKDFINSAKLSGIYIAEILSSSEQNLYDTNILPSLDKFMSQEKGKSDFLWVWWEKDFLFSAISKINREQDSLDTPKQLRFLLVSSYNGKILEWYLWNLLNNKDYISDTVIVNDTIILQVIKEPTSLNSFKNRLTENGYEYIEVDTTTGINNYFFIARFINTLSNSGVNTSDIFILIMIPLLLTMISFMKHFIGISPIGIIIPLFISVLFYKIWVSFTLVILGILFITNLVISGWMNKYNLLYTPKVAFLTIINIIVFFISLELILRYNLLSLELTDIVYILFFIVVSEKLITIIVSKEFKEYRKNFIGTIAIWLLGFGILSIPFLQIFILAYPETIVLLAPLNFMMGRFTGLRVTEYFRFKEIINNIEDEE